MSDATRNPVIVGVGQITDKDSAQFKHAPYWGQQLSGEQFLNGLLAEILDAAALR